MSKDTGRIEASLEGLGRIPLAVGGVGSIAQNGDDGVEAWGREREFERILWFIIDERTIDTLSYPSR